MKPIAITMGDPAGIGPEIVLKLIQDVGQKVPLVVLGDVGVLKATAIELGFNISVAEIARVEDISDVHEVLKVIPVTELKGDLARAQVSATAGHAAFEYVARAIELAMSGAIDAIVTAPLNKEALRQAGLAYPGHTEILAELSHTRDYTMMMASDELRVVLVTIHEALREAVTHVDQPSILRVIRLAHRALRQAGIAAPRIGVAGLNPHAGENGLMGSEEIEIIGPAVNEARSEGIDATGPYPPDTVFLRARNGDFDVVVAQYHDQGLIPFKYLGLDKGVNVTIGLPFVRTSVDHGTAFDIVGRGIADHRSLLVALDQALQMIGEPALAVST
ncbi:4-hydroxythreonine-4-phosphate dehydrogenase PdxA [Mycobacteroides abscessus]|uniref:4-hydroxythreonine-4-phosphate dehydrogenase PdxA n=1 Tax=Mycobacteroides abscessus TaxID=36809 RepID=UPI000C266E25|nr:4-hydroxythreonine-4-phosphate dehydrogenase PdxA [Mycobacteroides abscessus]